MSLPQIEKAECPKTFGFLVRVTGLEPARQKHQNLNLARLPFRHTRVTYLVYDITGHLSSPKYKIHLTFCRCIACNATMRTVYCK